MNVLRMSRIDGTVGIAWISAIDRKRIDQKMEKSKATVLYQRHSEANLILLNTICTH